MSWGERVRDKAIRVGATVAARDCFCGCGRRLDRNLREVNLAADNVKQASQELEQSFNTHGGLWRPEIHKSGRWMHFAWAGDAHLERLTEIVHGQAELDREIVEAAGRWAMESMLRRDFLLRAAEEATLDHLPTAEAGSLLRKVWLACDEDLEDPETAAALEPGFPFRSPN